MNLSDLADDYIATRRPGWLVLEDEEVLAQAVDATRYYLGFGTLASGVSDLSDVDGRTDVSASEWVTISPLFRLYVEKENTLRLEASRSAGLEVYGRQASEIQSDITAMETETLPQRAFAAPMFEVS